MDDMDSENVSAEWNDESGTTWRAYALTNDVDAHVGEIEFENEEDGTVTSDIVVNLAMADGSRFWQSHTTDEFRDDVNFLIQRKYGRRASLVMGDFSFNSNPFGEMRKANEVLFWDAITRGNGTFLEP